ncbi:MAG: hypothetical protein Q9168_006405 [Polycauliona sp. 1 TL-2023]
MTIAALPSQTIRAIGSTQVLTDSASAVKELVDNALDAQATSITVEISTNVLDIIQVKDNGHGIAPIDRPLVCKSHCTSKIKDLDDLATIGGASLGFRGEALASAVELSGGLTVTTRIVGEATAVSLKVGQDGEVINEERVSHAVGTTVRITDFLKNIPVRRQTALKHSAKQLSNIKRTLQAYSLARPSVRLSLRVLKAKTDNGNWIYAPKSDASVSDAALKVVGKKLMDECQWVVWAPNTLSSEVGAIQGDETTAPATISQTYRVEALLPKPDAGTLKQIVQLYKSYFRSSCNSSCNQKITDPFLCMNLVCPPGSYDANVEPAKDDVLFSDSPKVLEVVEAFLKCQYGEIQSKTKPAVNSKPTSMGVRNFDLLLAKKPPQPSGQSSSPNQTHHDAMASSIAAASGNLASRTTTAHPVPARSQQPADEIMVNQIRGVRHWLAEESSDASPTSPTGLVNSAAQSRKTSSPNENEGELSSTNGASHGHDEDEEELRDIRVSNPWTFAKLNAPIHPQRPTVSGNRGIGRDQQLLTPAKKHGSLGDDLFSPPNESIAVPNVPTPARSQNGTSHEASSPEAFPYPMKRWGKGQRGADVRQECSPEEEENSSPTRLETWMRRPRPHPESASQVTTLQLDDLAPPEPHRDFLPASELPQGTPLSAIPDISQAPRRKGMPRKQAHQAASKGINKPFKPPAVQDPNRLWFDHLDKPSTRPSNPNRQRTDHSISAHDINEDDPITDIESTSRGQQHPGLALTMDYETRKAAAIAQRRALLRQHSSSQNQNQTHLIPPSSQSTQIKISPSQQSSSSMPSSSPHKNRYIAAIAALYPPSPTNNEPITDPNAAAAPSLPTNPTTTSRSLHLHLSPKASIEGIPKIPPSDPRAQLIRYNTGLIKRLKQSYTPLETPSSDLLSNPEAEDGIRNLTHTVAIDTEKLLPHLSTTIDNISGHLCWSPTTEEADPLEDNLDAEEVKKWQTTIVDLVKGIDPELIISDADGEIEGNFDLVNFFASELGWPDETTQVTFLVDDEGNWEYMGC